MSTGHRHEQHDDDGEAHGDRHTNDEQLKSGTDGGDRLCRIIGSDRGDHDPRPDDNEEQHRCAEEFCSQLLRHVDSFFAVSSLGHIRRSSAATDR